jgi:RNA polymerase sigma-70 factor, ECF subfamily
MSVRERVEHIYEAEREHIYSYLLCFGVPAQRAQELAQDSFVKLYIKMSRGESIENPRAWLYRVAHNAALRFHRREAVFDALEAGVEPQGAQPDPERALMDEQRKTALRNAILDLSPRQRNCLELRARGLRHWEIAEAIGISTSAASEFLRRAVLRLREALHGS